MHIVSDKSLMRAGTRPKCVVCNGTGIDYGETCLDCGGQGRIPFRADGRESDEDLTPEELAEEKRDPRRAND